jgi:hypothetical protein
LQHHQTAQQRERERALLWVGEQYRQAIASYHAASPSRVPTYPTRLQDLLQDPRYAQPRRHLRRLYADPITGNSEWALLKAPGAGAGIVGVASLSSAAPLKRHGFAPAQAGFEAAESYAEWRFVFVHDGAAPPAAAGGPASPPPPVEVPPAPPPPPYNPISDDQRAQCLRTLSASSNACLVLPVEEVQGCRQRAREEMLRCVRGGG